MIQQQKPLSPTLYPQSYPQILWATQRRLVLSGNLLKNDKELNLVGSDNCRFFARIRFPQQPFCFLILKA